jgi:hypothetical protein
MTTITWKAATSGNFTDTTKWTGGVVPASGNDALLNPAGPAYTVTIADDITVGQLGMGSNASLDINDELTITLGTDPIGIAGRVTVKDGAFLSLGQTIDNTGTIILNSGTAEADLNVNTLVMKLQGGGKILLSGSTGDVITGVNANYQFDNVDNIISGAGNIGDAHMMLTNEHGGVINANVLTPLTVDTASSLVTNFGTMQATNSGTLILNSPIANTGGTILAAGSGSEIIVNAPITGGSVLTSGGGTILFNNTNFSLDGRGTHPATNTSNLQVANGHSIWLYGVINNTGTIGLNSTGVNTDMLAASGHVTLMGGGRVILSNNSANRILAYNNPSFTLTNFNNTISGAGQLGVNYMAFENSGTVNANQSTPLTLYANNVGGYATNTRLLEATSTGGLDIHATTVINTGGTLFAGAGSHVDLSSGSNVQGGTLSTAGTGIIQSLSNDSATLDGVTFSPIIVAPNSKVQINENSTLNITGSIINKGTIFLKQVSPNANYTDLRITYSTVTLSGGGKVTMTDNSRNRISANDRLNTLINADNTISGSGELGAASLTLVNQAGGVIDANGPVGTLRINTQSSVPMINAGILKSTNTTPLNGGLQIYNTAVYNAGGIVEALGNNSHVDLTGGTIAGGTLITTGTGALQGVIQTSGGNGNLDGAADGDLTIAASSKVQVNDNTRLYLEGNIVNHGTIIENSTGANTFLYINSPIVTLSGGGQVKLSSFGSNFVQSANDGLNVLVNQDNTITGAGQLGNRNLTFVNAPTGIVNANLSNPLVLNTHYSPPAVNQGLLESTTIGGLTIQNTTVSNSGTIMSTGAGHVDLADGGTIQGGVMKGLVKVIGGNGGLDGTSPVYGPVHNQGTVSVIDHTMLYLNGNVDNIGKIVFAATSSSGNTGIRLSGNSTLTGHGSVVLSNNDTNAIQADNDRKTILDNFDNTISGTGQLGNGYMTFVNEPGGVISANMPKTATSSGALNLDTRYSPPAVNRGLMQATNTGGLGIWETDVVNAGGTIQALAAGSHVDLHAATISGGTIKTGTMGAFRVFNGSHFDGQSAGPVTNAGTVVLQDQQSAYLEGTINNTGRISLNQISASGNTTMVINSQFVTLTGGGSVVLSNTAGNVITAWADRRYTLVNLNNTISGAGLIGDNMQISNSGTVTANQSLPLVLSSYYGGITNNASGLMQGTGAGGLEIQRGIFLNKGTVMAKDGSAVSLDSSLYVDNNQGNELYGGKWIVTATTHGSTMSVNGGAVVIDSAAIELNGPGTVFQAWNGSAWIPLESSLTTISPAASLRIGSEGGLGRNYVTSNAITDSGKLVLAGGTIQAGGLAVNPSGQLFGFGTVKGAVVNYGKIESNGGTLTVTGAVTGAGLAALQTDAASTLVLNGATNTTSTVLDNGVLNLGTGSTLTTGAVTGTGTLQVGAAARLNLNGTTNSTKSMLNSGTVTIGASDSLTVTGAVDPVSTGIFVLTNASLLEVKADTGATNKISFLGVSGDTLTVDAVASFGTGIGTAAYTGPLLKGFSNTIDKIDLKNFVFNSGTNIATIDSFNVGGTGLLQMHSGAMKATLLFSADLGSGGFHLASDGGTGTLITHS